MCGDLSDKCLKSSDFCCGRRAGTLGISAGQATTIGEIRGHPECPISPGNPLSRIRSHPSAPADTTDFGYFEKPKIRVKREWRPTPTCRVRADAAKGERHIIGLHFHSIARNRFGFRPLSDDNSWEPFRLRLPCLRGGPTRESRRIVSTHRVSPSHREPTGTPRNIPVADTVDPESESVLRSRRPEAVRPATSKKQPNRRIRRTRQSPRA